MRQRNRLAVGWTLSILCHQFSKLLRSGKELDYIIVFRSCLIWSFITRLFAVLKRLLQKQMNEIQPSPLSDLMWWNVFHKDWGIEHRHLYRARLYPRKADILTKIPVTFADSLMNMSDDTFGSRATSASQGEFKTLLMRRDAYQTGKRFHFPLSNSA